MNLHITHDNVFIDYIINCAQQLNVSDDRFVIYTFDDSAPVKVKSKNVLYAKHGSDKFINLVGSHDQYTNIYVHWLEGPAVDFVNSIPRGIKIIWCFWGGDGLELPHIQQNIFQTKSLAYFKKHSTSLLDDLNPKSFYNNLKKKYRSRLAFQNHLRAIARIDYFAHYLIEDYQIIKAATSLNAQFIPFHYAAVEDIVPDYETVPEGHCSHIMLGNSDTLSNNHFEAIDLLAAIDFKEAKVYCPLNYEAGHYASDITAYGKKKLGESFIPLLQFLPKEDYGQMLAHSCMAIMNHDRSQALGNICVLLWNGARVFMSEQSSLYHYLKEHNCNVFSLQKDLPGNTLSYREKLQHEQILHNRKVLLNLFGREHQMKKIKSLLTLGNSLLKKPADE